MEKFEGATGLKTAKCGLFVNREHPYLAASPDAVFGQTIPVEIKCPFVSRNKNIDTVTVPYLMQNDGLTLDSKHDYYYQIQGQMMCTGADMCYFVVFTFKDLKCIRIKRDNEFIEAMKDRLVSFYESHFKQNVIHKLMYRDYSRVF